ncbi:MAG: DUF5655 domain-containing protein [Phycisphaerales bacterium]
MLAAEVVRGSHEHIDTRYSVHPSIEKLWSWIPELRQKTGRSLDEWVTLIARHGPGDEKSAHAWLKSEHGIGTNTAGWLAERAFRSGAGGAEDSAEGYLLQATADVEAQYSGKKAHLRPIYEALLDACLSLGPAAKACPCKTMVPLFRHNVFAQIKAPAASRVELGLCLRGEPFTDRLLDTGGTKKRDRITHAFRLSSPDEIDRTVLAALKRAFVADRGDKPSTKARKHG